MSYIDPTRKLLAHLDRLADLSAGSHTSAPVNVELDLSNRCNLACRGCHMAFTHSRGPLAGSRTVSTGDLIDPGLAVEILHQLREAGVKSVTFSGGGEPTLHPKFLWIAERCPLPMGLYTNGTRIDKLDAARIRSLFEWIVVSIDYPAAGAYEENKGPFWSSMLRGLFSLTKAEGRAVIGASFLLGPTFTPERGEAAVALARKAGADYVQFRPMVAFDPARPGEFIDDRRWIDAVIDWLKSLQGVDWGIPIEADPGRFRLYRDWAGHGYERCWWSLMQTVITPDGRVWTCANRRGMDGSCLGDLTNERFADIWQRSQAEEVNPRCRILCRGHLPNLTLHELLDGTPVHKEFI